MLTYDPREAMRTLCKSDGILGRLIQRAGPITIDLPKRLNPFDALLRSIIYQQLSGKAAAAIHTRVRALFSGQPSPPSRCSQWMISGSATRACPGQKWLRQMIWREKPSTA